MDGLGRPGKTMNRGKAPMLVQVGITRLREESRLSRTRAGRVIFFPSKIAAVVKPAIHIRAPIYPIIHHPNCILITHTPLG